MLLRNVQAFVLPVSGAGDGAGLRAPESILLGVRMAMMTGLVALFAVVTVLGMRSHRTRPTYPVTLLLAGLLLRPTHAIALPPLDRATLYGIFLPGLLFEAASHLKARELHATKVRILALAVPGVLAGAFLTAALVSFAAAVGTSRDLPLRYALIFGAIVAATDPVAVVGLLKQVNAPRLLRVVLEGESLVNDATGIVLVSLVLAFVSGETTSLLASAIVFARVVGRGLFVGVVCGFGAVLLARLSARAAVTTLVTMVAAYGSFQVAELVHGSGVIATVVVGVVAGNFAHNVAMTPTSRAAVARHWDHLAFGLNAIVFLLLGLSIDPVVLAANGQLVLVGFAASLVARGVVVFLVSAALRPTHERMPWAWSVVLTWSGVRGALSMVLATALPPGFPHRDQLIAMTAGMVLVSTVVQGPSLEPLLRALKLSRAESR